MKKVILTFDLEYWYNTKLLDKYIDEKDIGEDLVEESLYPLLDLLDRKKVKATFFVLGKLAEKYPGMVKEVYKRGHEVASHGYSHRTVDKISRKEFEEELRLTEKAIVKAVGRKPVGYRAPDFSLTLKDKWAFDVLRRRGYLYDSSIFPFKTGLYGEGKYFDKPFDVNGVMEIPLPVYKKWGVKIPIGGGFYFRFMPLFVFSGLLGSHAKNRMPILYLHPHELHSFVPNIKAPFVKKKLKYWGVRKSLAKFEKLLDRFEFVSVGEFLKNRNSGKFDLHSHTHYSKDSFMKLNKIVKVGKKRGLKGIAITDHNKFEGAAEANDQNFMFIPGEEVKTDQGDVIGLFIRKAIKARKFAGVVKEIESQKGVVVIPHPYGRNSHFSVEDLKKADVIETFNARQKIEDNVKAASAARKLGKPVSAGSDAHVYSEIGKAYVILEGNSLDELKESLLKNKKVYGGHHNYFVSHAKSVLIERLKRWLK